MVAVGLLRSKGIIVSMREFVRIGLPFTMAAVTAGSLFLWMVWVGPRSTYSPAKGERVAEPRSLVLTPEEEEELRREIHALKKALEHLKEVFEGEEEK
jgi:hypothetical protein